MDDLAKAHAAIFSAHRKRTEVTIKGADGEAVIVDVLEPTLAIAREGAVRGKEQREGILAMRCYLIVACACVHGTDTPIFKAEEAEALRHLPFGSEAFAAISDAAMHLIVEPAKEAAKKSEPPTGP